MPGRRPAPAWGRGRRLPTVRNGRGAQRRQRRRRNSRRREAWFRSRLLRHRGGRGHTSPRTNHTPRKVSHTAPLMPSSLPQRLAAYRFRRRTVRVRRPRSMCVLGEVRVSHGATRRAILDPAGQDARRTVLLPATGLLRHGPQNASGEAPALPPQTLQNSSLQIGTRNARDLELTSMNVYRWFGRPW